MSRISIDPIWIRVATASALMDCSSSRIASCGEGVGFASADEVVAEAVVGAGGGDVAVVVGSDVPFLAAAANEIP